MSNIVVPGGAHVHGDHSHPVEPPTPAPRAGDEPPPVGHVATAVDAPRRQRVRKANGEPPTTGV